MSELTWMSQTPIDSARAGEPRVRPYPGYKDSGVEWLREIPTHWEVKRTKFAARLRSGHTPSRQHPEYWQNCTIPWFGLADVWQIRDGQTEYVTDTAEKISELGLANSAARLLPKGTVMLSRTASVGFSAIMGVDMATTQDFVNWVCGVSLRPEYLLYVFRSMQHELARLTMGSTHQTIYMPDVGRFSTPIPPIPEQDRIVEFIREHAKKIDSLVEKKERLIELLQEKRSALITRAVTKGLDRNVAMKDSGVEWLGEIPANWQVRRVRHVLRRIEQGWSPDCENREAEENEWGVLKAGCVNRGQFVESEHKALPPNLEPVRELEIAPGDLLMSRASGSRELVGSVAVVPMCRPRLLLCDKLFRLRVRVDCANRRFMAFAMNSWLLRWQIEIGLSGGRGLATNITQEAVKDLIVLLPPLGEQGDIVTLLDRETAKIDALVDKVRSAIDRLKELRTALISAAVTGKIDVREASVA